MGLLIDRKFTESSNLASVKNGPRTIPPGPFPLDYPPPPPAQFRRKLININLNEFKNIFLSSLKFKTVNNISSKIVG